MRRLGAVPVFEEGCGVKGIESFIERDYMSSEDDGPGLVSQEVWDAKAKPKVELLLRFVVSIGGSFKCVFPFSQISPLKSESTGQPAVLCTGQNCLRSWRKVPEWTLPQI